MCPCPTLRDRHGFLAQFVLWASFHIALGTLAPAYAADRAAGDELPGHYIFNSYGATMGLANVGVEELQQDRLGFIWVGTDDGLYRYDGYHFDSFGLQQGLPSTEIEAL